MTRGSGNEKMNPPTPDENRKIAITVGDAAGIGPEISLRAAAQLQPEGKGDIVLYGPKSILAEVAQIVGLPICAPIIDVGHIDRKCLEPGIPSMETGQASFEAVELATQHAIVGSVDAIVTGPIQKEAWNLAGVPFPGHTELLADRTNAEEFCMMLTSDEITCCLVTIHLPIADVPKSLTVEAIERTIRLAAATLSNQLGRAASITVCGLNPHAGEKGQFSYREEEDLIQPAVDRSRRFGINVSGPVPPDTAFTPERRKTTDAYVCMYHDQGLIPLKALSFDDAVNVTLGLPLIRTSVDHGTALDLAWKGEANHQNMIAAIKFARQCVKTANNNGE